MLKRTGFILTLGLVAILASMGFFSSAVWAVDRGQGQLATGLNEPTPEELEWINQNFPVVQEIKLNPIALERINEARAAKGLRTIAENEVDIAPMGSEAVLSSTAGPSRGAANITNTLLSALNSVDNSVSPAFPPIGNQGSIGSCACFATTYYQLTYETNLARGRTASGGDTNVIFSPKWTYNMINGGGDNGSSFAAAYALELKNGAATWAAFPYSGNGYIAANYLAWSMNPAAWSDALNYRPQSWAQIYSSNPDTLISNTKAQLANGHILVFGTYVYSWVSKTIGNDPSTNADDAFVGKRIATYMNNTGQGGHGMTVVGYNDDIWCDLNGNGAVNAGEKGAFKIANSWGTSDWNSGFRWITYDSLRTTSAVPKAGIWPTIDRAPGGLFMGNSILTVSASPAYTPTMKAEITLNQAKRGQLSIILGLGSTTSTVPATTWRSEAVYNSGGNYAFDGTTTACDGTFFFDFTDLAQSASGTKRWFVRVADNSSGSISSIKSFKLYQGNILVGTCTGLPRSVDYGQAYIWIDYALNSYNLPPVAVLNATPASGDAPLTVNFDGSASSDPDGTIAAYAWNFGDGSTASGVTANHTYSAVGKFTAILTVTDNNGAAGSRSVTINAIGNQPPTASFTASPLTGNAPLTVSFNGSASSDPDGTIAAYAWNFGDGSTASGATASHTYPVTGVYTATLTVVDDEGATGSKSRTITVSNASIIIKAPSSLRATKSYRTVFLKWTDNSTNEQGFYVERATRLSNGTYSSYSRVATIAANVKAFTQSVSRGAYRYRVQAFNTTTGKVSSYSNIASISVY